MKNRAMDSKGLLKKIFSPAVFLYIKLRGVLTIITLYKNWPMVILNHLPFPKTSSFISYELRDGLKIIITSYDIEDGRIVDNTFSGEYNIPGFEIEPRDLYNIGRCNFLKLDCERAEYEILLSASKFILQAVDKIAFEYHSNLKKLANLIRFLEQNNFCVLRGKEYESKEYKEGIGLFFARNLVSKKDGQINTNYARG